jgi:hypothetical protein
MNRRGFLQAILAAGVAPAFVRSSSLMLLVPRREIWTVPSIGSIYVRSLAKGERRTVIDGRSWATAFTTIVAAAGDRIYVAADHHESIEAGQDTIIWNKTISLK